MKSDKAVHGTFHKHAKVLSTWGECSPHPTSLLRMVMSVSTRCNSGTIDIGMMLVSLVRSRCHLGRYFWALYHAVKQTLNGSSFHLSYITIVIPAQSALNTIAPTLYVPSTNWKLHYVLYQTQLYFVFLENHSNFLQSILYRQPHIQSLTSRINFHQSCTQIEITVHSLTYLRKTKTLFCYTRECQSLFCLRAIVIKQLYNNRNGGSSIYEVRSYHKIIKIRQAWE